MTRPLPQAGWQVSHWLPEIELHPNAPTNAITAAKRVVRNLAISDIHTGFMFTVVARCTSNDLPFSSKRRTDPRSYHGREKVRAQPAPSRHRVTLRREARAFGRCNGLLGSGYSYFGNFQVLTPRAASTARRPSSHEARSREDRTFKRVCLVMGRYVNSSAPGCAWALRACREDLIKLGPEAACRANAKLALEGKDYVVRDGDVIHFKFNV